MGSPCPAAPRTVVADPCGPATGAVVVAGVWSFAGPLLGWPRGARLGPVAGWAAAAATQCVVAVAVFSLPWRSGVGREGVEEHDPPAWLTSAEVNVLSAAQRHAYEAAKGL